MQFVFQFLITVSFVLVSSTTTVADPSLNNRNLSEDTLEQLLELSFDEVINYEVVTPTRSGMPLSKIPGAVSVITYQDIQHSSASTIPELLRLVPGVNVRWNPMVQTIDIRSFGSNPFTSKILLMIDGVPYNSWNKGGFPQHPGFDFFNINNVKHIEVVRGAGSTLYGENALNGVINIVTFSGEEFNTTRARLYSGNNDTNSFSVTSGLRLGDSGSFFATARVSEGQLPTELWQEEDSKARAVDVFVKGKYKGLQLSYYRRQDDFDGFSDPVQNPVFPPGSVLRSAREIKQTVNIVAAQFNHQASNDAWSLQGNASYSNRDGSHCAACHSPAEHPDFEKQEDHGYQIFANAQLGVHAFVNHDVMMGAEYRRIAAGDHDHEFHGAHQVVPESGEHEHEPDTQYHKSALFIQDTWTLPGKQWQLIYGLRYDQQTSNDLFDSEVFPRVALVGSLSKNATLRFNWSQSARYPSFTELYQDSRFLAVEAPGVVIPLAHFSSNEHLQPETLDSYELGISYQFSQGWQARVDLFRNEVEDSIVIAYPRFRFENHPNDARIHGIELDIRAEWSDQLSGFFNWSYQHNREVGSGTDSEGNALDFTYAPKHKANFGLVYQRNQDLSLTLEASWRDQYVAPAFWYPIALDEEEARPLDDYAYLNVRLDYKPGFFGSNGNRPLTISLIGKNLGDETPYETLTGFGGRNTGREFFVSFSYDWPFGH
ncbi:TonB-dependent receptor [Pseudomaricurvus alkylphenolicus]|uniref:TonB-dependent receptor plug domain-containing protein n=1 Tax=Pseudomaricurvus alkylphenolicus TaxID=1306991 RepID=UPI00142018BC|nr:TonB-dependent receptor [Pseudomaricurvus alkylphenolicus]NIB42621.1 TonB-dependent receptor [Pseudomaricurvus alkylphenolicus]